MSFFPFFTHAQTNCQPDKSKLEREKLIEISNRLSKLKELDDSPVFAEMASLATRELSKSEKVRKALRTSFLEQAQSLEIPNMKQQGIALKEMVERELIRSSLVSRPIKVCRKVRSKKMIDCRVRISCRAKTQAARSREGLVPLRNFLQRLVI